jgi:hypothetical protein
VDHIQGVRQQLNALSAGRESNNAGLYRDLALYLQVLREGLLNAVQQACFHLATRFYPERYCDLDPEQRASLHRRIAELVQRCCSLLTVEQLVQLAGQIGRERRQQQQRRQREWLAQMRKAGDELSHGPPSGTDFAATDLAATDFAATDLAAMNLPGLDAVGGADASRQGSDPDGSIQINAALPVDLERWHALINASGQGHGETFGQLETAMEAQSSGAGDDDQVGEPHDTLEGLLGPQAEALLDSLFEKGSPGSQPSPWDSAALPIDPEALQEWLVGFERALVRRLRNLSHAVNVELLRSGLSRSLLPTSLLQAALQGQLEPQPAPANLLRLQVPLAPDAGGDLDSVALLLRLTDLELDQPRLRTCRSRWQRHRQEIRRMAERHRRLQRQLQRFEAERLWHQDNPSPSQSLNPSQPSPPTG